MPSRTTPARVGKIIRLKTGADIGEQLTAANELVTEVCEPAGYNEGRLSLIETWLAAHYVAIQNPRASSQAAGPVSTQFEPVRVELGLRGTKYGQQALRFDTKGGLAALDNAMDSVKATLPGGGTLPEGGTLTEWLGTPNERNYGQ